MGRKNGAKRIFVSHISEEAAVAALLKEILEADFLGLVSLFTSSGLDSIGAGQQWLVSVENALKESRIGLVLCSKSSVHRPWVQFELGAAWMRGIPIIPICHSGLTVNDLDMPLSLLQAVELGSSAGIKRLYRAIAEELDTRVPELRDLDAKLDRIARVEERFRSAGSLQFEHAIDVVIPPPGKLEDASIPAKARVVSDARSLGIFGLAGGDNWTWGDIVRAAEKVDDRRWVQQLQQTIQSASRGETFDAIQAVFHTPKLRSYQPQLARKELNAEGEARFHVHFVETVVAPLTEVDNDFGLLATLLRLGLRFRYEVIERFAARAQVPDGIGQTVGEIRNAIEIIENDARSRGSQKFADPIAVAALFATPQDQQEMANVRREWEQARARLYGSDPEPRSEEVGAVIASMRAINVRFMTLGTRRYHEMVKARWH